MRWSDGPFGTRGIDRDRDRVDALLGVGVLLRVVAGGAVDVVGQLVDPVPPVDVGENPVPGVSLPYSNVNVVSSPTAPGVIVMTMLSVT